MLFILLYISCKQYIILKTFAVISSLSKIVLNWNNSSFRDLNNYGKLGVCQNFIKFIEYRVENLLDQLTLEEKAGMIFISGNSES